MFTNYNIIFIQVKPCILYMHQQINTTFTKIYTQKQKGEKWQVIMDQETSSNFLTYVILFLPIILMMINHCEGSLWSSKKYAVCELENGNVDLPND
ncbi:hypothetical protein Hanom_Chr15g01364081 [Helianthus anomalus]